MATGSNPRVSVGWVVIALVLSIGAVVLGSHRPAFRCRRAATAAALLGLAAGIVTGSLRLASVTGSGLADLAGQRAIVQATGVLTGDPVRPAGRPTGHGAGSDVVAVVPVRVERLVARGRVLDLRASVVVFGADRRWADLLPGQRVRVSGRLAPAEAGRPVAAVISVRGPPRLVGRPPALQRAAGSLRAGLRTASTGLPSAERGLLPGLVVGDTSRMSPQLVTDFQTAGLTHLVAVSGANLAIVVGFMLLLGRWVGLRGRWLPLAGALALVGFVVLARPQPSVLRAGAMGAVGLVAMFAGLGPGALGRRDGRTARSGTGTSVLSAAVLVLVLADPWLARSYGFALSVLATGGLVVLATRWAARLRRRGVPAPVAVALAVPVAAQLACAPVIVLLSSQVSLVAVPANMLTAPAVAPATILGVLATVVSPVSDRLAAAVAMLAGLPTWWIVAVAEHAAGLPIATLPWSASVLGALALAACSIAVVLIVPRAARTPTGAVGVSLLLVVSLVVPSSTPGWPPGDWVLAVCDVGQGDALVLAAGPGTGVVIDAGPDPRAVDRCLARLGVRRVPALVLTHLHADHVEGLPGVLGGRIVGEVLIGPYDEPAAELARVRRWVRRAGVPLGAVSVGDRISVGRVAMRVLWPARIIDEDSVPNNASIVLLAQVADLRLLLTGDVEPPAQQAILARTELPRVDVLKVAHHGSAYQVPELLDVLRPRVALISVGADNDYGHPATSTIRSLQRAGAIVGRTDIDGTLVVVGRARSLRLVRAHG